MRPEIINFITMFTAEFFAFSSALAPKARISRPVPMITYRSAGAGYCIDSSRNQGNVTNELKARILGKNRR